MARTALLLKASANRVFGEASFALCEAELHHLDRCVLGGIVRSVERAPIGGVDYLVVDTAEPMLEEHLTLISNLSSLHALYEIDGDGRLRPLTCRPRRCVDDDLLTIQRYAGKTNEAFTHLLVNVALAASGDAFARLLAGEPVRLLDPACGRGTSLNRAVAYGMDACGVEVDRRDVEAYTTFFTTWLKDKRYKHQVDRARLRKGRERPAQRWTITYGPERERAAHHVVDVVQDDTTAAAHHFRAKSMDLLVCDLPYGVQHGSSAATSSRARSPRVLLETALPVWWSLLRPGSAAAFAWNRRTLERASLVSLAEAAGFDVMAPDDEGFVHRVDRAITRDVLVAARPAR